MQPTTDVRGVTNRLIGSAPTGEDVHLYTLDDGAGFTVEVMTLGATLTRFRVPDAHGNLRDVALGYDDVESYARGPRYLGATVGRVANRIANGRFRLKGTEYILHCNSNGHHLHGGANGFDQAVWQVEDRVSLRGPSVRFHHESPDGDEGYPGTVNCSVTYTLLPGKGLELTYKARTTSVTPINLTNHTYFNLAGRGDVLHHNIMLHSDYFTPVNEELIPTGEVKLVDGTAMDFRTNKLLESAIEENSGGFDHNFVVKGATRVLRRAAVVSEPESGLTLVMHTTEPAFQFYTGNFLDGTHVGRNDHRFGKYAGFCLEAQHYPDSPNNVNFPTILLAPSQEYRQQTRYFFEGCRLDLP